MAKHHEELQQAHEELKRMQSHVLRAEKMASLGQLAAGVAHEINNPIGYIKSNLTTLSHYFDVLTAALAERDTASGSSEKGAGGGEILAAVLDDLPGLLADCQDGVDRVEEIVRGLRSFAHSGDQEFEEADLHEVLDSAVRLAWNELKYHVELVREYGELPPVSCRPTQLNQVFLNLLVNAAHAISGRGKVILRTQALADEQVQIEVEDDGEGIPPEVLSRIFDPFFTTKPVGQGTGLGLSVSNRLVEDHGGTMSAQSTPGQGTVFRVVLPIRQEKAVQR